MAQASYISQRAAIQAEKFDVIVVGSGIGGLSAAAILSKAGRKVLVLERHYTSGGFSHSFKRKGYEWEVGVHYVGKAHDEKGLLRKLLNYITDSKLKWEKMPDVYDRLIFGDAVFDFPSGKDKLISRLKEYFPDETEAIERYFELVGMVEKRANRFFSERALPKWLGQLLAPVFLRGFWKFSDRTTFDVLREITTNKKLIGVLTGQYGDYGLPPKQSSFAMHALLVDHYLEGASYPVGGSASIAQSIGEVISKFGGKIAVQAEVVEVIVEHGKACGVRLENGDELRAPVIISNAGARNTYSRLLPKSVPQFIDDGLKNIKPSISHISLYIGINESASALGLQATNLWIYPGYDHDENINRFLADPNSPLPIAYISFPSIKDPTWESRYPGKCTIEVIGVAPYEWFVRWENTKWHKRGEDYEQFKESLAQRLLNELYCHVPGVKGKIDYYEVSTPLSTRHFANHPHGEIYGLEHTPARFRARWLRPQSPVKNLFLAGQDIVTDGVGAAAFSGVLAASAILRRNVLKDVLL